MPMLAYLDALLAALAARDTSEIDRLLAHPLARILSPDARADAMAERRAAATGDPAVTPLNVLQLRYRTAQLLGGAARAGKIPALDAVVECADSPERPRHVPAAPAWAERRPAVRQMELPLSA
jgi:hypothetical protein